MFGLGVIRAAWNIKAIKDALLQQASNEAPDIGESASKRMSSNERQRLERERRAKAEKDMEVGLEMVKLLPHAIQTSIRSGENEIWSSVRDENLIVPASEILIKHGHVVAGDWNMVGILDAIPDEVIPTSENNSEQFVINAMAAISLGALGQLIGILGPVARMALGRPATSFGMTPLLIFREVAA